MVDRVILDSQLKLIKANKLKHYKNTIFIDREFGHYKIFEDDFSNAFISVLKSLNSNQNNNHINNSIETIEQLMKHGNFSLILDFFNSIEISLSEDDRNLLFRHLIKFEFPALRWYQNGKYGIRRDAFKKTKDFFDFKKLQAVLFSLTKKNVKFELSEQSINFIIQNKHPLYSTLLPIKEIYLLLYLRIMFYKKMDELQISHKYMNLNNLSSEDCNKIRFLYLSKLKISNRKIRNVLRFVIQNCPLQMKVTTNDLVYPIVVPIWHRSHLITDIKSEEYKMLVKHTMLVTFNWYRNCGEFSNYKDIYEYIIKICKLKTSQIFNTTFGLLLLSQKDFKSINPQITLEKYKKSATLKKLLLGFQKSNTKINYILQRISNEYKLFDRSFQARFYLENPKKNYKYKSILMSSQDVVFNFNLLCNYKPFQELIEKNFATFKPLEITDSPMENGCNVKSKPLKITMGKLNAMQDMINSYYNLSGSVKNNNYDEQMKTFKKSSNVTIIEPNVMQGFTSAYYNVSNPLKGLIINGSVGSGKTCQSILLINNFPGYRFIWVTKKSLEHNVLKNHVSEICNSYIKNHYMFLKISQGVTQADEFLKLIPSLKLNNVKKILSFLKKTFNLEWSNLSYRKFANILDGTNSKMHAMWTKRAENKPFETTDILVKTFVFIDEAHLLYHNDSFPKGDRPNTECIKETFQNSYQTSGFDSARLILLSGTVILTNVLVFHNMVNLLHSKDVFNVEFKTVDPHIENYNECQIDFDNTNVKNQVSLATNVLGGFENNSRLINGDSDDKIYEIYSYLKNRESGQTITFDADTQNVDFVSLFSKNVIGKVLFLNISHDYSRFPRPYFKPISFPSASRFQESQFIRLLSLKLNNVNNARFLSRKIRKLSNWAKFESGNTTSIKMIKGDDNWIIHNTNNKSIYLTMTKDQLNGRIKSIENKMTFYNLITTNILPDIETEKGFNKMQRMVNGWSDIDTHQFKQFLNDKRKLIETYNITKSNISKFSKELKDSKLTVAQIEAYELSIPELKIDLKMIQKQIIAIINNLKSRLSKLTNQNILKDDYIDSKNLKLQHLDYDVKLSGDVADDNVLESDNEYESDSDSDSDDEYEHHMENIHHFDKEKFNIYDFKKSLPIYSPKAFQLSKVVMKTNRLSLQNNNRKQLIFGHDIHSIRVVAGTLLSQNVQQASPVHWEFGMKMINQDGINTWIPKTNKKSKIKNGKIYKRFMILTKSKIGGKNGGWVDVNAIQQDFKDLKHGADLVIFDKNFMEGVDLPAQILHIFDKLAVKSEQVQVIGRASRYCGLSKLGAPFIRGEGWKLDIYRYQLKFNNVGLDFSIHGKYRELFEKNFNNNLKNIIPKQFNKEDFREAFLTILENELFSVEELINLLDPDMETKFLSKKLINAYDSLIMRTSFTNDIFKPVMANYYKFLEYSQDIETVEKDIIEEYKQDIFLQKHEKKSIDNAAAQRKTRSARLARRLNADIMEARLKTSDTEINTMIKTVIRKLYKNKINDKTWLKSLSKIRKRNTVIDNIIVNLQHQASLPNLDRGTIKKLTTTVLMSYTTIIKKRTRKKQSIKSK
jgi:hypothetical protein